MDAGHVATLFLLQVHETFRSGQEICDCFGPDVTHAQFLYRTAPLLTAVLASLGSGALRSRLMKRLAFT